MIQNDLPEQKAHNPLVSILCITCNQDKYIKDSLDSFLNQETDFPFEIIIHDDASHDNTRNIIIEYANKYPSLIKAFFQEKNQYNQTGFAFINKITPKCKGRYIAICEGDDYWIDNKKLQKQLDFLIKNKSYSMSYHNAYKINSLTNEQELFIRKGDSRSLNLADIIYGRWKTPTASLVLKKELVNVPESKSINADVVFILNSLLNGKIHYIDQPMSVYRYMADNSLSLSSKSQKQILYQKKLNFLTYVDKKTSFKYIHYTIIGRLKVLIGYSIFLTKKLFITNK